MSYSALPRTWCSLANACAATAGIDGLDTALEHIAKAAGAFLAVTNGPDDVLWREQAELRRTPVLEIETVDTLGAGDVFHGAFALALAEGQDLAVAVRFGSAAASLKCMRLGGSMAAPFRSEIDGFDDTAPHRHVHHM
jgi:sulfofructose kinase